MFGSNNNRARVIYTGTSSLKMAYNFFSIWLAMIAVREWCCGVNLVSYDRRRWPILSSFAISIPYLKYTCPSKYLCAGPAGNCVIDLFSKCQIRYLITGNVRPLQLLHYFVYRSVSLFLQNESHRPCQATGYYIFPFTFILFSNVLQVETCIVHINTMMCCL